MRERVRVRRERLISVRDEEWFPQNIQIAFPPNPQFPFPSFSLLFPSFSLQIPGLIGSFNSENSHGIIIRN